MTSGASLQITSGVTDDGNKINKNMTIKDLDPRIVWNNFYLITRQPRPSKHEEKVRAFLLEWAKGKGIDCFADEGGNIIMRTEATPGMENRKGVILQAHMDMVPQKISSSKHDFLTDPIETIIDGEWVKANGTTLGADDGLGVALAMSVAEDKNLRHGPVEILLTYDEETGLSGAEALKAGVLKGDILLNLDSEDDDELCIGCAGGLDATADFKISREDLPDGYNALCLDIKGLQGGHSGMDISLYRANANKVVARILSELMEEGLILLTEINGGSLRNAIPFEARAVFAVKQSDEAEVRKRVESIFAELKNCYKESDPDMQMTLTAIDRPAQYIESEAALRAVKSIVVCPSNVIRMSRSMEGLTETSTNLGIVRTLKDRIEVSSFLRSAIDSSKADLAREIRYIFEMSGAEIRFDGDYPGWVPKPESPLISMLSSIYERLFGEKIKVVATHGGLECAILGATYPNWDMISIGPTVRHPHSPDERCLISSVGKMWKYLTTILEEIPEKNV